MEVTNITSNDRSLSDNFKVIVSKITAILKQHDITVKPFHSDSLPAFNKLSPEDQMQAIQHAQNYLEVLNSVNDAKWSYKDDLHFLWRSLKVLKLTPSSDIFEHIKKNDAVEIFNLNNIQVWRNLASLDLLSYTLEEIYCYSWEDRYIRNEQTLAEIKVVFEKMFALKPPATYQCNVQNIITEVFSEEKLTINANHKAICLLFDSNSNPSGYLVVSDAKILRKNSLFEKPHRLHSV